MTPRAEERHRDDGMNRLIAPSGPQSPERENAASAGVDRPLAGERRSSPGARAVDTGD